jgi:uncharacterized protein (TIGR03437 family)
VGTCSIQATQPGNGNYAAAPPVSQHFTVTLASQTITFGPIPNRALGSGPSMVSATASSGLTVSFSSTTLSVCTVSPSGAILSLLTTGTCTIKASQAGNSGYAAALPVSQTFTVDAGSGAVTVGSVLNAASYSAASIAANADAVAFGTYFSTTAAQAGSLTLPTTLAGATVTIADANGLTEPASLYYASPTQINFVVPGGLAIGAATVTVTNSAGSTGSFGTAIAQVAPSLFTADSSGTGPPAASALVYATGTAAKAAAVYSCTGSPAVCMATPINLGAASTRVYLVLYGTGIRGRTGLSGASVTLGGIALQVDYAGAQGTYAGLDQVNVLLDHSLAGQGQLTLQLTVDGVPANPVVVNIG